MEMKIQFPGGKRIDALYKGFTIGTDQPEKAGGGNTAPAPFDLFLASLGTCAGYYAQRFLEERGLSGEGLALTLRTEKDRETRLVAKVVFDLHLPEGFPPKYERAIVRAIDQCTVKKNVLAPPQFETVVSVGADPATVDTGEAR
jgi:ribosomal protein S12 methylthiotransferase accessory factor